MRLSIDLAARFSAGMVRDAGGYVVHQFDSWGKSPFNFAQEIAEVFESYPLIEFAVIEDVPYGLKDQSQFKPALKLQGRIEQELEHRGVLGRTLYVQPSVWQRHHHLFKTDPGVQAKFAADRGYTPPDPKIIYADSIPPLGKGDKEKAKLRTRALQTLNKSKEDYVSAFLIGEWANTFKNIDDVLAVPGAQPAAR